MKWPGGTSVSMYYELTYSRHWIGPIPLSPSNDLAAVRSPVPLNLKILLFADRLTFHLIKCLLSFRIIELKAHCLFKMFLCRKPISRLKKGAPHIIQNLQAFPIGEYCSYRFSIEEPEKKSSGKEPTYIEKFFSTWPE